MQLPKLPRLSWDPKTGCPCNAAALVRPRRDARRRITYSLVLHYSHGVMLESDKESEVSSIIVLTVVLTWFCIAATFGSWTGQGESANPVYSTTMQSRSCLSHIKAETWWARCIARDMQKIAPIIIGILMHVNLQIGLALQLRDAMYMTHSRGKQAWRGPQCDATYKCSPCLQDF